MSASGGFGIPVGFEGGAIVFFTVAVGDFNAVYVEFPAVGPGGAGKGTGEGGYERGPLGNDQGFIGGQFGFNEGEKEPVEEVGGAFGDALVQVPAAVGGAARGDGEAVFGETAGEDPGDGGFPGRGGGGSPGIA